MGYDRAGNVEGALVAVLTPDGERVLLRRETPDDIRVLTAGDPLRRAVRIDGDRLVLEDDRQGLPAAPRTPVRTERDSDAVVVVVVVVTLDRPQVRNAIDELTARLLARAVDDAEADDTVRVIVLAGAGGTFCAGMDLVGANRGRCR